MKLYDVIVNQINEDTKYELAPFLNGYIRASLSGRCLKMRKYSTMDIEITNEMTNNSLLVTNFGHAFHEWMQAILSRKFGKNFIFEKRLVNNRIRVTGAFDGIIYDPETKCHYLIDIKTTNPYKIKHLDKQNSADVNHIRQLLIYDYLIRQPETKILEVNHENEYTFRNIDDYPLLLSYKNDDNRKIVVLYIMRDAINMRQYEYSPNDKEMKQLLERELRDIAEIHNKPIEKQRITNNEWECKYCPYYTKCKGE